MRILMINYEFPPLGGGGGVACYHLAKEMAKDHQVDFLTSGPKDLPNFEVVDGIRVHRVPVIGRKDLSTATILSMLTFVPSSLLKGIDLCINNKYDIINAYFVIPSGITGLFLSKLFKIPIVTSALGGDIYDPSKKWSPHRHCLLRRLIRFLTHHSDVITAESNDLRNKLVEYYKIDKLTSVIPLGFVKSDFEAVKRIDLGLSESDIILISVGRLVMRKAYDKAIRAVAKLPLQNFKYLIIGDGPEEARLRELARELEAEEKVQFLGFVSEKRKYQYLAVSDIYLLSSLHEGFGLCLLEAMYCGLPIVATNNGGQTDFLMEGRNAMLVPVEDEEAMAKKIEMLIADKGRRSTMSANNKDDVKRFYIDGISKDYIDLYQRAMKGGRRPGFAG